MNDSPWGRWLLIAKVVFLVAGGWFVWRGLDGRWGDLRDGLTEVPPWGLGASFLMVLLGLLATGVLWKRIVARFGFAIPLRTALAIFFFGQLGKYIPGSVWSFGAQAEGARRHQVPLRTTVAASMVFLGLHVVTGAVVGFGTAAVVGSASQIPVGVSLAAVAVGLACLAPSLINRLASWAAGQPDALRLDGREVLVMVGLMCGTWTAYAVSLVVLRPTSGAQDLALLFAAFAIAYVAGVLVFLAPAGLGAREATFVLIAGPTIGIGSAASVALITRVSMTLADVFMAIVTSVWARSAADP